MGTRITESHDAGKCKEIETMRKQSLKQLRALLKCLDACERHEDPCKPISVPLITYPDDHVEPERRITSRSFSVPPWERPRIDSTEMIASRIYRGCQCSKRNGLQDGCPRTGCQGMARCMTRPYPSCDPSGMWKKCVTETEAKEIMSKIDALEKYRNPICHPDRSCNPQCLICSGPASIAARKIAGCIKDFPDQMYYRDPSGQAGPVFIYEP